MKQYVNSNPFALQCAVIACTVVFLTAVPSIFGQTPVDGGTSQSIVTENYKIGPGDMIDVLVSNNEKLSRSGLKVSNRGTVQLAMIDTDFDAACLTERQLADAIKEKYRKFLVDPYVNVAVRESNSNPVAVLGAVNSPGRFQMQRSIRFVELMTFVNGTRADAGSTAEIFRSTGRPYCVDNRLVIPSEGGEELISVSIANALQGGEQNNPVIFAGDIVRVPVEDAMNAYIQGNVRSSSAISLKEPVTLTQAIAMAGGPSEGAQLEKVTIRRPIPGSLNREALSVNVKDITRGKRDDILLQPNDIIEVPGPSGVKKVFQDIIKTIVPTVTNLPLRVIR